MDITALLSICGILCFLVTVVGAIVGVVIVARKKYGDEDEDP
jgi:hypothetical protein